jgi:hypothetical protein
MKATVKFRPILNFAHSEGYTQLKAKLFLCLIKHRAMKIRVYINHDTR